MSGNTSSQSLHLTRKLPPDQAATITWLTQVLAAECEAAPPMPELFASSWRSEELGRYAITMLLSMLARHELVSVESHSNSQVECVFRRTDRREQRLILWFSPETPGRLAHFVILPTIPENIDIRPPRPSDIESMRKLEISAPVQRDDGTEVIIDHNGKQFDHAHVVKDHRWLAAFDNNRMLAVQGVAVVSAPIDGQTYRIAYNHYSRSDPETRNQGYLLYLVFSLYRDLFPQIDQFVSIVDVKNPSGLRLSFGQPWPTRVRRLFLSVKALAAESLKTEIRVAFNPVVVARILNATHEGLQFWVPRTPEFLLQRQERAPTIYHPRNWYCSENAALAIWPSAEKRTYTKGGHKTMRTLAIALDYGFLGVSGTDELHTLLLHAAADLLSTEITHIALFVSDDHDATAWLSHWAEAYDEYAICAPVLQCPPVPTGPIYIDHVIF